MTNKLRKGTFPDVQYVCHKERPDDIVITPHFWSNAMIGMHIIFRRSELLGTLVLIVKTTQGICESTPGLMLECADMFGDIPHENASGGTLTHILLLLCT